MVLKEKFGKILLVMIPFSALGPEIPRKARNSNKFLDARTERRQRGPVEGIGNPQAIETALVTRAQRIAQRRGEPSARLRVILQVLQHGVGQVQVLPAEDGELPGLVVLGLGVVHVETKLQWPVKHVGLGKAEPDALRQIPDAGLDLKRLTQTEEVVGRSS